VGPTAWPCSTLCTAAAPFSEAMLYAFDLLEIDDEDLPAMPPVDRKRRLARLLGGRRLGSVLSDHTDDDAPRSSGTPVNSASKALCQSG
jgi:ATP-dependent DNA ligase